MNDTNALAEPIRLGRQMIVHLPHDLGLDLLRVDDTYWSHLSQQRELSEGRVLTVFDYQETWSWWERHPVGDELVYVLEGEIDLHLDDGVSTRALRISRDETAVVPTGAWHRAIVPVPSRLLFVTPTPARTEHRPA